ncbi:MAG TPA: S26 family signal peptidase [Polyangiaceae bacterium]|nr:S26 family signal peptidase [Polyangiaceae bacterium]
MRTWLKIVGYLLATVGAILFVLHQLLLEVWRVPTDDPLLAASIEPTLTAGDLVVVTRHASVGRGNLLRCADPQADGRFVVARAIGRYGDEIELTDEVVSLDGQRNPSPRACDTPSIVVHDPREDDDVTLSCSIEEYGDLPFSVLRARSHQERPTKAKVEPGKWFLVSDDRHVHLDSRDYGQIDPTTCQHVVFRLVGAAGFGDKKSRLSIVW